jgi:hypothetical protein
MKTELAMHCDRCEDKIAPGEESVHHGQVLCEDCYMDALSPARTCDPWAVRSAALTSDQGAAPAFSENQQRILQVLGETGGTDLADLAERLALKKGDAEREIAALRHMEKVRGALENGRKIIRLW